MRAFDRDLIRGGHYGQRSCEPHQKAEHMAAPTNAAFVKKALANSEPSTHGPSWKWPDVRLTSEMCGITDIGYRAASMGTRPLALRRTHARLLATRLPVLRKAKAVANDCR